MRKFCRTIFFSKKTGFSTFFFSILCSDLVHFITSPLILSQKSSTCLLSCDNWTFQRAVDFIFLFNFLILHQKVRANFVINHRFRDYRSPRLKGQKLASYKVLISSIGVVFGHILEKWWFEDFMKILWKNYVVGCFIALAKRWVVCASYVAKCLIPSLV